MGSPRNTANRRRRISVDPAPACMRAPWPWGWHTQGEKDELTSCRGTVWSAWHSNSSESHQRGWKTRLPVKKVKGSHVVRGRQNSPVPARSQPLSAAEQECARVTGKAGGNGQNSSDGAAALTQDKTVGSRAWLHIQGLSECVGLHSIKGGDQANLVGRYRLGHWPVVPT